MRELFNVPAFFSGKNNLSGSCEKEVNTFFSQLPDTQNKNLRFLGLARKFDGSQPDTALCPVGNYTLTPAAVYV